MSLIYRFVSGVFVAMVLSSVACSGTDKSGEGGKSFNANPTSLVSLWGLIANDGATNAVISQLALQANGRAFQWYRSNGLRFAQWLAPAPAAGVDTLTWALSEHEGEVTICFSGDLIGQKSCYPFAQRASNEFTISTHVGTGIWSLLDAKPALLVR